MEQIQDLQYYQQSMEEQQSVEQPQSIQQYQDIDIESQITKIQTNKSISNNYPLKIDFFVFKNGILVISDTNDEFEQMDREELQKISDLNTQYDYIQPSYERMQIVNNLMKQLFMFNPDAPSRFDWQNYKYSQFVLSQFIGENKDQKLIILVGQNQQIEVLIEVFKQVFGQYHQTYDLNDLNNMNNSLLQQLGSYFYQRNNQDVQDVQNSNYNELFLKKKIVFTNTPINNDACLRFLQNEEIISFPIATCVVGQNRQIFRKLPNQSLLQKIQPILIPDKELDSTLLTLIHFKNELFQWLLDGYKQRIMPTDYYNEQEYEIKIPEIVKQNTFQHIFAQ